MKTVLIFDASSVFHRAFWGIRSPLSTRAGLPTGAVFGYVNILKKHLDRTSPDYAVAAFDLPSPTFRHKMDAAYKATRKPMPDELRMQLPYLRRVTEALGIAAVEEEGYEADDILGTLSRIAEEEGCECILVTGDRDSYQLVSERVTLSLATTGKDESITPEVIREKFGVTPAQMIAVKALAGDSSDNISGVKGIGEKTALKLVSEFGDLDGIYRDVDALPLGPAAKEKIRSGKEDAYRSLALATICRTVPKLTSLQPYAYQGVREEPLRLLFEELEFYKFISAFHLEKKEEPLPLFSPPTEELTLFDQAEERPAAEERDAAGCPTEGVYLSWEGEELYLRAEGKNYRLVGDVEGYVRRAAPVVCNYKEYLHLVARLFGDVRGVRASFDLPLAAYVIHSARTAASLSDIWQDYMGSSLPMGATECVESRLEIMEQLTPLLEETLVREGCEKLYREIELPLSYVLAKMELRGFLVSREGIRRYGEALRERREALEKEIHEIAGRPFLISSPKQLGQVLFEELDLPHGKKTKTGWATDAETLQKIRHLSPIIDPVLEYRAVSKLASTYVDGLLSQIGEDGRIRTVFHQTMTATGRLSSAEPNLQNIPVRTDLGRQMRRFFLAPDGMLLVDADYSQIELRLLAHVSGDETLISYFQEGKDIHTKTASEIFHVDPDQVTSEMRKCAKAVNFGIVYGIGEYSLSQDLSVPVWVAKDYIKEYFALFPKVKSYLDQIKLSAAETGQVTTLFGRSRRIPELKSEKKALRAFGERIAMNAPIQGTAADLIKLAMVRVDRRLETEGYQAALILQIHDELILEAPEKECEAVKAILSEEMEKAASLSVPLVAEAIVGKSWFDCK